MSFCQIVHQDAMQLENQSGSKQMSGESQWPPFESKAMSQRCAGLLSTNDSNHRRSSNKLLKAVNLTIKQSQNYQRNGSSSSVQPPNQDKRHSKSKLPLVTSLLEFALVASKVCISSLVY